MDLLLPLVVSLILIAGGGGRQHASFADAAMTTVTNTETLTAQWKAVLPGIPVPPAISDLIAHQNGQEVESSRVPESYGSGQEDESNKGVVYGAGKQDDSIKVTASYGLEQEEESNKVTASYGPEQQDSNKATVVYGVEKQDDSNKVTASYGLELEEESNRVIASYGPGQEEDSNKATVVYGVEKQDDSNKVTASYGLELEDESNKVTASYGPGHEEDPNKATVVYGAEATREGSFHVHVHSQKHKNKRKANVFFFRDMLRQGSVITPTISPTTSLPKLLPRHVANSIPFSTERLSDIVAMFAPASLAMTRDIGWALGFCEHPRTVPGEKSGCATSLESLAELPASLLGTSNVHAFSATNFPVEALGTPALRGRYNVTAVRNLSSESTSEIVTCHDLTYPYALYYCHTASPAAAYMVTLTSVDGGAPAAMEALAVCHLDTSHWSPKNPFFELHNLKPGDVAVCHFLTKLSIVWVRADGTQAATRSNSV